MNRYLQVANAILCFAMAINVVVATPIWSQSVSARFVSNSFVHCINRENGHPRESYSVDDWDDTLAHLSIVDDFRAVIGGRIGHHGTWAAVLDLSETVPKFYETYNEGGRDARILFRVPMNALVMEAFETCGATFSGVYQGEVPERQHFAEGGVRPDAPDVPYWFDDLRVEEILPPQ